MKKMLLSLVLLLVLCLMMTGCSKNADTLSSEQMVTEPQQGTADEKMVEQVSNEEPDGFLLGNDPNNLLQSEDALCFGDGRMFFVVGSKLCSYRLDGNDYKEHGEIAPVSGNALNPEFLNYGNNCIYFKVDQNQGLNRWDEIRCFDLNAGTVRVLTSFDGVHVENMLLVNNTLFCFAGSNIVAVNVDTKEVHTVLSNARLGDFYGFDTDERYLYMLTGNGLRRFVLADAMQGEATCEIVFDCSISRPGGVMLDDVGAVILADGGIYAHVANEAIGLNDCCFFSYAEMADIHYADVEECKPLNWPHQTFCQDAKYAYGMDPVAGAVYFSSYSYMLSRARVSISSVVDVGSYTDTVYYSATPDHRQPKAVGTLNYLDYEMTYAKDNEEYLAFYSGVYDGTLYFVMREVWENPPAVHMLSADGVLR